MSFWAIVDALDWSCVIVFTAVCVLWAAYLLR